MEKNNTKKELTLNDIAELIKLSAEKTEKNLGTKIESSIDELAAMTQKNFLSVEEKLDGVEKRLGSVERKIDRIEAGLNKKVDKIDHNTLTYRVEKLEKKFA